MIYTILLDAVLVTTALVNLVACARLGRDLGAWLGRRYFGA